MVRRQVRSRTTSAPAEVEARLRAPALRARAREERENLELLLEALDEEDRALYTWAYSTVQSRAFVVRERRGGSAPCGAHDQARKRKKVCTSLGATACTTKTS